MDSNKIYKLSTLFKSQIEKRSDVTSDLATRIMHSLVPTGRHPDEDKQNMTLLVATHLIGVAERYIDSAIKIILDEFTYSSNPAMQEIAYSKPSKDQYIDILNTAINAFNDPKQWDVKFGGKKWLMFSERLLDLYNATISFKEAKNNNDAKEMNKQSGLISVYLNVLDGMSHNSDSFLNRIINQEIKEETVGVYDEDEDEDDNEAFLLADKKQQEITELMDAKELHNKHDVLNKIKNKIYNNPESYLYREYFRDSYKPQERSNPEILQQEMQRIRDKKIVINFVNTLVDNLIDEIGEGIKNGDDTSSYLEKFNRIIMYPRLKNIRNDIKIISSKYNLESMFELLHATEEIKEFILNNVELTLPN